MGAIQIYSRGDFREYEPFKKISEQARDGDIFYLRSTPETQGQICDFLKKVNEESASLLPQVDFRVENNNTIVGARAKRDLAKAARNILLSWALFHLVYSAETIDKKFQELLNA